MSSETTPDVADRVVGAPGDAVLRDQGDRESFSVLFERHVEAVWNHAHRLSGSWDRAEDVTSATFLAAWRTRAEARPAGHSALPSLCAMAGDLVRATARTSAVSVVDGRAEVVVHRIDGDSWPREVVDAEHAPDDGIPVHAAPRALPAEVRARLRAEFDRGLDHRPKRSSRLPAVLLAAAVLLACTVLVLRQPPDAARDTAVPVATGTVNQAVAAAALDRCWSAVRRQGVADRFPDRSRWKPVFTVGDSQIGVVAARADGKPLFCQTTATTATVTDPSAAPGTGTAAVLFSREGVVAGVTDVDWRLIALRGTGPHGSVEVRAEAGDHMFVARTGVNLAGIALTTSETGSEDPTAVRTLTAPAPPLVVASDQPDGPAPERASEAGRALGDCLARSSKPLPDPDSYQTGALVTYPGGLVVLGRSSGSLVTCQVDGEKSEAIRSRLVNSTAPAVVRVTNRLGDGGAVIGGELVPEVATIEIGDDDPRRPAVVAGRTFAFPIPSTTRLDPTASRVVHAVARDANGAVLFENFWQV